MTDPLITKYADMTYTCKCGIRMPLMLFEPDGSVTCPNCVRNQRDDALAKLDAAREAWIKYRDVQDYEEIEPLTKSLNDLLGANHEPATH